MIKPPSKHYHLTPERFKAKLSLFSMSIGQRLVCVAIALIVLWSLVYYALLES